MEFLRDLWKFLRERKAWWITPLVLILVLIGVLLILGSSSPITPLIYTLF